ncbi:MAG: methyltransferase domain-containing protein [Gammaproteobacteria bacterium]|nr:methyltransferase domain-containing protein [Gammaproteobacteria bacterium]
MNILHDGYRVHAAYERQASSYDQAMILYRLLGLRIERYRSRAMELLELHPGQSVIDLGCGTGLNFAGLQRAVGPRGRIIGVDFSARMLDCARDRVSRAGWTNVELVEADLRTYSPTGPIDAALATGVLGYLGSRCDQLVERLAGALAPSGRMAIVDGRRPPRWPSWLFGLFVSLCKPFGVGPDFFSERPLQAVRKRFGGVVCEPVYGGLIYVAAGTLEAKRGDCENLAHE